MIFDTDVFSTSVKLRIQSHADGRLVILNYELLYKGGTSYRAAYSASAIDKATHVCLLLLQLTTVPPIRKR